MYSEKVMDHFKNPRNMGEMPDADAIGESENKTCGDLVYLYIKVKEVEGKEILDRITFQTFGCAAAIATSSMMTVMAEGKTLDEALNITRQDVAAALGGLPEKKMHCSNLASDVLRDAIRKYRAK